MRNRYIALLSIGHLVTDVNQGALPALIPFLIAQHNLSYTAAAGIIFAANISSSLVQPLFGYFADRLSRPWLIPSGLLLAGAGIALTGVVPGYWVIFSVVAMSGIGIAAFHPEAARLANLVAGEKKGTSMSIFATGGQLGFAIGPIFTIAILTLWGLKGTLFLFLPVTIIAVIFVVKNPQFSAYYQKGVKEAKASGLTGKYLDAWGPFSRLALVVTCRSIIFYGLNTFLPLYWINVLNQSKATGGTALTILFTAGVTGTLLGGRFADRFGYRRVVLTAFIALTFILPILVLLRNVHLATLLLVPIGFLLFAPFSPMIVMGQKYLPNHIGFASGVTLGLAITVGGIAAPLLGRIADNYGIQAAIASVVFLPAIAASLAFTLPSPEAPLRQAQTR